MTENPGGAREISPFQKTNPAVAGQYEQMPPTNSRPIFPFVKSQPPSVSQAVPDVEEELDVPDPKDESAAASVASLESQRPSGPVESETPAPIDVPQTEQISAAEVETTSDKASGTSSPSSSSETNPGWSAPPAPGKLPPTSGTTPTP